MKEKEIEELTQRIQEKAGKETSGLIADDIGLLLSDTKKVNLEIEKLGKEIERLKDQKEKLIETNGNLLQQISVGEETSFTPTMKKEVVEEETTKLSFKDSFDERGNFKR